MITATEVRTDFANRLYARLAEASAGKDVFLSPFSIQVALAMCAVGAQGETRKVLAELIGAPLDVDEQNRQYAAWLRSVSGAGANNVQLAIANALWGQTGSRVRPEYQQAIAEFYDGTFNELDFRAQPEKAVTTINAWVESRTAGKIRELIRREVINEQTRLILTNAIYFKGKWDSEFDKSHTWDEDWHGAGDVCKVPMMQQRFAGLYYECADFQALDLPYRGEQLSMLVVLPRKKNGLAALESQWTANTYQQVTQSLAHEETVIVSLPRFKIEAEYRLKPALCDLGARIAFGDDADFGGIGAESWRISEVVHKAYIEVNEEGTEAAAATGVLMAKCAAGPRSEPKVFLADHPFLFVIRDRSTNAVLFCGRVLKPEI